MRAVKTTIVNRLGLHARPAMAFVEEASRYSAAITVHKSGDDEFVDGKSILQMLMLAGTCGTEIEITADGADEAAALEALVRLVESKFGEDE